MDFTSIITHIYLDMFLNKNDFLLEKNSAINKLFFFLRIVKTIKCHHSISLGIRMVGACRIHFFKDFIFSKISVMNMHLFGTRKSK